VRKLIEIVQKLVDRGNSVMVLEHNMEMIKCADHIIDIGPEGGEGGGKVVAVGSPEELVGQRDKSYTGEYLKRYLN
jgi:excinuclease ABC subunit A